MEIQKLKDVFQKFATDNNRAILVDGVWGIGKTYYVLQFLKDSKNNKFDQRFTYVSLFGKSSMDEVHTAIYCQLHPVKHGSKRIVQIIPKVAPLLGAVGDIVSNLEFALKENEPIEQSPKAEGNDQQTINESQNDKVSERISATSNFFDCVNELNKEDGKLHTGNLKKKRNIIILDDLERMNFDKISFADVLGYINSLFLQNFKVIMICNSQEIIDKAAKDFSSFKEKVFDREYYITSTNRDVINSYFSESAVSLEEYIVSEFDNNLRIAHRVSNFYVEAINIIRRISPSYKEKVTEESILWGCTLIVVACNTTKYDREGTDKESSTDRTVTVSYGLDDMSHRKIRNINQYVEEKRLGGINTPLLAGLLLLYHHNSEAGLNRFFRVLDQETKNILLEEPFYRSDAQKEKLFDEQFTYIVNQDKLNGENVFQAVRSMCDYEEYSRIDARENEIIRNMLQKCEDKDIQIIANNDFFGEKVSPRLTKFRDAIKIARVEKRIEQMCIELKDLYKKRKYSMLINKINLISDDRIYFLDKKEQHVLAEKITDTFRECNYFIDDLFGDITIPQWELAHLMCSLAYHYSFSDQIVEYLLSIDYKDDRSAKQRYEYLIQDKLHHNI